MITLEASAVASSPSSLYGLCTYAAGIAVGHLVDHLIAITRIPDSKNLILQARYIALLASAVISIKMASCNVFAFVLFVSPMPTFKRIMKNKSTEQFSVQPYIYSLLNCFICLWYGLPFVSYGVTMVVTVNSIGAAFQLVYVILFIAYADSRRKLKTSGLLMGVIFIFALIVYVSLELFDHQTRQTFVGYLNVVSLISMFASPLFIINLVIRTRSVEFMPFHLSLATFLTSLSFFAYGSLLCDFFIYIPNGIGTVLGITQLLLYAYYSRKSEEQEALSPLLA